MALTTRIHNAFDNEMVYAVVRMDHKTHKALKEFMHCDDKVVIRFKHGVKLCYRGYGWYRLEASNSHRAVEKVEFALKLIRRFMRDEEAKTNEALKLLAPTIKDPDLKLVSFSNAHSEGEYGYMGIVSDVPPPPVSTSKLNALVAKFQRPQHKAH
jgi:hypothetical protein